jgi:hypothetical protein
VRKSVNNFIVSFITFESEEFFDHTSSARTLQGLIMTFNNLAMNNSARSIVKLNLQNNNLDIFLGCNDSIVLSTLSKSV